MTLDAIVGCDCWERGNTRPPPVPIRRGESGIFEPVESEHNTWECIEAVQQWRERACMHPGMELLDVEIGSWEEVAQLCHAIEGMSRLLPTLGRALPTRNDGHVSAADSASCLRELLLFESRFRSSRGVLVDLSNGHRLHSTIAGHVQVMLRDGDADGVVGLDVDGVFVVHEGAEVFRAKRIRQTSLSAVHGGSAAELKDLDTGARWSGPLQVLGLPLAKSDVEAPVEFSIPELLEVRTERTGAEYFSELLSALRAAFDCAVTNEAVVWWC